jgi:penicillin-binding protein 2
MNLYLKSKHKEKINFHERLQIFAVIIGGVFLILFLQLAYVQILAGSEFRALSDKNRIRLLRLKAPRGLVYDRRGNLLIDNRPSFTVNIIPAETSDPAAVIEKLKEFTSFDEQAVMEKLRACKYAPFSQIPVASDVSIEQAAPIEEYSMDLPGTIITAEPCRRFPLNEQAAHVLGYLGEIDPEQLERWSDRGYVPGDYVGKSGLECVAENWLHGESGGMQVQVYSDGQPQIELDERGDPRVRIDSAGRELLTLGRKMPEAGNILHLTLDLDIQKAAEELMSEYDGAVIVMGAKTGAIRAMVSRPSFDPNVFVSSGKNVERADILTNPRHPLLNRALQAYSPGSTFKIVMAYAALCEGVVTPEKTFSCSGSFTVGRKFRCWKDTGHGSMNVLHGIAYSCDVFFYNVGLQLGIERIDRYARMFGLGGLTGIELTGEMRGLIPSPAWKEKVFKNPYDKRWYDGETVNAAIGQGYTLVTPMQMVRLMAAIVNGGNLVTPYIIDRVTTPGGEKVVFQRAPTSVHALGNADALNLVQEGLRQVVESRSPFFGTAWRAKNEKIAIMGKTGTAQVVSFKERADTADKLEQIPFELRDHAWFVASIDTPEEPLAMVIFCEHSGHASESAVLVGRELAIRISDLSGQVASTDQEQQDGQST